MEPMKINTGILLLLSNGKARLVKQHSLQECVAHHRHPQGCPDFSAGLVFGQQFSGEDENIPFLHGQKYKFPIWDVAKIWRCFVPHTFFGCVVFRWWWGFFWHLN